MKSKRRRLPVESRFGMMEPLEVRMLLSAAVIAKSVPDAHINLAFPTAVTASASTSSSAKKGSPGYSSFALSAIERKNARPIRAAYGFNQVTFGNIAGDGSGQTIAIIDAYHYPTAYADLHTFSTTFGLYDLAQYNGANTTPYFRQVAQNGSTSFPSTDPAGAGNGNGTWELEESLDIEWAHTIAPKANIILVEATNTGLNNLLSSGTSGALWWARQQPGVSVISMSFGSTEFSGETTFDQYFTAPSGHAGITFTASTGDDGSPGGYPAYSPNVIAVGGTSLTLTAGSYGSESGWSGSGGGKSTMETKPSFQNGITTVTSTTRMEPDVSMDADPNSGVAIIDSWDNPSTPWVQIGGTSLSSPMFAGLMAVVDQARSLVGLSPMNGGSQTLPAIYSAAAADFHDVIGGSNGGFSAIAGYDLVTGRGTPVAQLLIPDIAGVATIVGHVYQDNNGNGAFDSGEPGIAGASLFLDANGNGTYQGPGSLTVNSTGSPLAIPDNLSTGVTSSLAVASLVGAVTKVTVTINITHTRDSDLSAYLIGPDGTQITLFSGVGGTGDNFTATIFDDSAATSISSGTAPFTGTFKPTGSLATFINGIANGTWKLKVTDTVGRVGNTRATGTLNSWSITVASAGESTTTSAADGSYFFNVPVGSATVGETALPMGYVQSGNNNQTVAASHTTELDFGAFPTTFNVGDNEVLHLWVGSTNPQDPTFGKLLIGSDASNTNPIYQLPMSLLPSLTIHFTGSVGQLIVDYINGSPLPGTQLNLDGGSQPNSELIVIGQSSSDVFTMTDTQIGLSAQGSVPILYSNLSTLTLMSMTVNYSGSLTTLNNLNINAGTLFNWT